VSVRLRVLTGAVLLLLFLSGAARAEGEPERVSVSVFNTQYDSATDTWALTLCPRWTNATVGTGYALIVDGTTFGVAHEDVPFRPGWSWPSPDNCIDYINMSGLSDSMELAVSATTGSLPGVTPIAMSCNVTIEPIDTFGNIGGTSYMCGSPQYAPLLVMSGRGESGANSTTFRLNHSLHLMNGTTYQYQYLIAGALPLWTTITPTSSATIDGGDLTTHPSQTGYRLANFTFADVSPDTVVTWRVRATDTFTQETGPYSCVIALAATDGFSKTCYVQRSTFADGTDPTWPMVNLTSLGAGLGLPAQAAGGVLLMGLAALMAGVALMATRSPGAGVGAAALAVGAGWTYNITPGWVLVISFYAAVLVILARLIPGGDK
jgi:hypothetical protein